MKEKLIKDLAVAIPIYKQLEDMYLRAYAIEDKKTKDFSNPFIKLITLCRLWVAGSMVSGVVLFIPMMILINVASDSSTVAGVFVVIAIFIGPFFFARLIGRRITKYREEKCDKEIDEIQEEINAYLEANDCPELYCVPEDCRNYRATKYIYEALTSGRADTLKEAMIQYKQQVQIWMLENKLNQQAQQIERLQSDIGYALSCIK